MVNDKGIEPHVPVWDKGGRTDGTFSRSDFVFNEETDSYTCPNDKGMARHQRIDVLGDSASRLRCCLLT